MTEPRGSDVKFDSVTAVMYAVSTDITTVTREFEELKDVYTDFNVSVVYSILALLSVSIISSSIASVISWWATKRMMKRRMEFIINDILTKYPDDVNTVIESSNDDSDGYETVDEMDVNSKKDCTKKDKEKSPKRIRSVKHSKSFSHGNSRNTSLRSTESCRLRQEKAKHRWTATVDSFGRIKDKPTRKSVRWSPSIDHCEKKISKNSKKKDHRETKTSKKTYGQRYNNLVLNWKQKVRSYDQITKRF